MIQDWAEPLILMNKHLQELQHLLNEKRYSEAMEFTFSIDAECARLRNTCWKEIK